MVPRRPCHLPAHYSTTGAASANVSEQPTGLFLVDPRLLFLPLSSVGATARSSPPQVEIYRMYKLKPTICSWRSTGQGKSRSRIGQPDLQSSPLFEAGGSDKTLSWSIHVLCPRRCMYAHGMHCYGSGYMYTCTAHLQKHDSRQKPLAK